VFFVLLSDMRPSFEESLAGLGEPEAWVRLTIFSADRLGRRESAVEMGVTEKTYIHM
jgi:hypothetical protein